MTSFIVTGGATAAQTLSALETGVVTSTGALSTGFTAGVGITGYSLLTVQGTISSLAVGVFTITGAQIAIGTGGVITGNTAALEMVGNVSSNTLIVTNAGIMLGGMGINFTGERLNLSNAGQIIGYNGAGMQIDGLAEPTSIRNSGTIEGNTYGIVSSGTMAEIITNSGMITGRTGALSLNDAASVITNTGVMGGTVSLNGGADRYDGSAGVQGDLFGGGGNDTVFGGAADDALYGDDDIDRLRGNGGQDSVYGGFGADTVNGNAGDDIVSGDNGADLVAGGEGDDTISGGSEADRVYGGSGDDFVYGGAGLFDDTLWGGVGDDTLSGSTGVDTFVFARGQGADQITDFTNDGDRLDLRAFDFASLAAVVALASASSLGLRIDVPGEGVIFVAGLTLATLNATDMLL